MAHAEIKITLPCDIKQAWNIITDVSDVSWRSDIRKLDIIHDKQFVEHTKDGFATTFTVTKHEPYQRWEFDIDNVNMKGHWTGIFLEENNQTTVIFQEDVTAKKFYMKPFIGRFLHKQQLQYAADLKKALKGTDK